MTLFVRLGFLWPILYIYFSLVSLCLHILHMNNFLMAYSVHVELYSIHTTCSWPRLYPCDFYGPFYLLHLGGLLMANFLYFLIVGELIRGTCTYKHIYIWVPLVTYSVLTRPLVTYSVHIEIFEGFFCTHTPHFDIDFSTSWNRLYTSDFYGLFCIFTSLLFLSLYGWYFTAYMCTFLWWHLYTCRFLLTILYIRDFLMAYSYDYMCRYIRWPIPYTFHMSVTYSIYEEYIDGITSFCTSNFYSLFYLFTFPWWANLYIFYGYACMYLRWPILYTCLLLVTYSVHKEILTVYSVHIPPPILI